MDGKDARERTDPVSGLSEEEAVRRAAAGLGNNGGGVRTKTEKEILFENLFTFFNILNFVLALLILLVGSFRNLLFMGVIVSNTVIGSVQAIRAKRTIDKLSLISAPHAEVLRGGKLRRVPVTEVVLGDVLRLTAGQQVCVDGSVREGEAEVNESLLTGESDPVRKRPGDRVLSGSFIVSGACLMEAEAVGAKSYANRIANEARSVEREKSEILRSLNALVRVIGCALIPIGILLFAKEYFLLHGTLQASVVGAVAAMIGMIPEGLILLTSVVFAVSVVRLSKYRTLVQDLYCAESLARVDVLCLDKTGTITEGTMQVDLLLPLPGFTEAEMAEALSALASSLSDDNATAQAIRERFGNGSDWEAEVLSPFSSARKWSGASFRDRGSFLMGAGEFLLPGGYEALREKTERFAARGERVLLLAKSRAPLAESGVLPPDVVPMGFIALSDRIRPEAPQTLRYFAEEGVTLKVISGDNVQTVSNIAKKAGLPDAENVCDASALRTEEEAYEAISRHTVFGRVTPQQKLAFVRALKAGGHTVAMTGDGVNDVLALKEADCSVAMASGSDAARTVSNLVLLDSDFSALPQVVREGRRSINNLQRSASLFLQKTIYSSILALLFLFLNASYPFEPVQLTFISCLTIGVPSFVLALEPNSDQLKGMFLPNVIEKSFPCAVGMVLTVMLANCLCPALGFSPKEISTICVAIAFTAGFTLLLRLSWPFNTLRAVLFALMLAAAVLGLLLFPHLFYLAPFTLETVLFLLPAAAFLILFTSFTGRHMERAAKAVAERLLNPRTLRQIRAERKRKTKS